MGVGHQQMQYMCRDWNIQITEYIHRIDSGWTVKQQLETEFTPRDIQYNMYDAFYDLAIRRYGIEIFKEGQYRQAAIIYMYWGLPLEIAIDLCDRHTLKIESYLESYKCSIKDHNGAIYKSLHDLMQYYSVQKGELMNKIWKWWRLGDALTIRADDLRKYKAKPKDHLGNEYSTITEMCKHYKLQPEEYNFNIKLGVPMADILEGQLKRSEEKALKNPSKTRKTGDTQRLDHKGNRYKNLQEMCKHYGISTQTFYKLKRRGYTLERIFEEYPKYGLTGKDAS